MGASVASLDRSGWSAEALARAAAADADLAAFKALKARRAAHPLADALDALDEGARAASESPTYRLKARDWGNGHREVCVYRHDPRLHDDLARAIDRDVSAPTERGSGDREASQAASVRRAKQQVRHLCKSMIVNSLWTLTYRAGQPDRDLCLRHLKAFVRRVRAVLPEFHYLAVLELQQRGTWHVHLATHALPARLVKGGVKLKSWDVMRAIWRSVVGDLGGNFDEAKRKRRNGSHHKPIRGAGGIASYIAGYVAKDMALVGFNRKRYSHSEGVFVPDAYRAMWPPGTPLDELIALCYAFVGEHITAAWFDADRGVFFLATDDSGAVG